MALSRFAVPLLPRPRLGASHVFGTRKPLGKGYALAPKRSEQSELRFSFPIDQKLKSIFFIPLMQNFENSFFEKRVIRK
jgi:hypothetical protein